jgi:ubiquinone/menaquinone biosynthesis C-methylase UbiE
MPRGNTFTRCGWIGLFCTCLTLAYADSGDTAKADSVQIMEKSVFSQGEAYERFMGRWSRALAPHFVAFCNVHDGESILDVGSGTGSLALALEAATRAVRVTGVDPAKSYVSYAQSRTHSHRTSFEIGDAQRLRFPDRSFDKTLSLLVLNFIPDPPRAVKEMVRVTRPGGIVGAAVWDYTEGMEMLRIFWDQAVALDSAIDVRDERHMPFCAKGELAALWRQHGLLQVEEASLIVPLAFSSFEDYWSPFLGGQGPAGSYVASLTVEQRTQLEQRLRHRLLVAGREGPITLKARAWAVKGLVPSR